MSYWHFFETLHVKPDSQETAQNFEKRILQKCLRITFSIYKPVKPFHFLKKTLKSLYPTDTTELSRRNARTTFPDNAAERSYLLPIEEGRAASESPH
jgi:hypothetical protein